MTTEKEIKEQYNDFLNEQYPLEGIDCNCFSTLLEQGDSVAYDQGFMSYCDMQEIDYDDLV